MINNNIISTVKVEGNSIIVEFNYEGDIEQLKLKNEPSEYLDLMLKLYSLDFKACSELLPKQGTLKTIYEKSLINNFINVFMNRVLPNINRSKFYDCVNIDDLILFIDTYEQNGYDLNIKRSSFNDINIFTITVLSFLCVDKSHYNKLLKLYYHLFNNDKIDKTHEHLIFGNALNILENEIDDIQCRDKQKMIDELEKVFNEK